MSVTLNRRATQKATTRSALVAASERCFERRGYDATGIADIAREAGVAYGTFYVHFESKGALLDASLSRFNDALVADLGRALSGPGALEARIAEAAAIFLDACEAQRWLVVALAERAGAGVGPEALRDGLNPPARAMLRARLADVIAPELDAELVVAGLLALWLRVALQVVLAERALDRDVAVATLARVTLGVLGAVTRDPRKDG